MKIEAGKRYVLREGSLTGKLVPRANSKSYCFSCPETSRHWMEDGRYVDDHYERPYDVVREYHDETNPAPEPVFQWKWMKPDRNGIWLFPVFSEVRHEQPLPDCKYSIHRIEDPELFRLCADCWCCFLCDEPTITAPTAVKKFLYVHVNPNNATDVITVWVADGQSAAAGWVYTNICREFPQ